MLVVEQRLSARRVGRGVVLRARFVHGVETRGWRMKFSLLRTEVEIDADPETYMELARRLRAANVIVKPGRSRLAITPKAVTSPILVNKPILTQPATFNTNNQMKPIYCQDTEVKVSNPSCHSPGAILPDLPQPAEEPDKNQGLSKEASSSETQSWLSQHRFNQHILTFANFSGADLLRRIEPRLTLYVCPAGGSVYSAIYLHVCKASELLQKLKAIGRHEDCEMVLVSGPNGTRVRLTDELVRHLPDNSTYTLAREHDALLLAA
ncbi:putative transcription factor CP2 [Danaus plexippus plexippus]|uniref:Transcription factor CP2 n=1 Tax=Danaus plexippus plexippus TaxID=278856 RepID=A0A212F7G2_DANPL|nr:putative transcription factor CP2 [Danaus plexippus plexippus]